MAGYGAFHISNFAYDITKLLPVSVTSFQQHAYPLLPIGYIWKMMPFAG